MTLTCDKIDIHDKVYFDTNSDVIQERSFDLLNQVAAVLRAAGYLKRVRVEGHTDSRGSDAFNLDLSQRRAKSVRDFLVKQGVDESRLTAEGFGESKPVASNRSRAGRSQNRRVAFVIVEQDARCAEPAPEQ